MFKMLPIGLLAHKHDICNFIKTNNTAIYPKIEFKEIVPKECQIRAKEYFKFEKNKSQHSGILSQLYNNSKN